MIDFNEHFSKDEPKRYIYETPEHIFLWKCRMTSIFAKHKNNRHCAQRFRAFYDLWK